MIERISRIVVAVEAGVILAPLTLLAMYGLFVALLLGGFTSKFRFPAFALLFALAALGCGWHIVLTFVRSGRESLVALPLGLWIVPVVVAMLSLLALFKELAYADSARDGELAFDLFVVGCPALVPLAHLAVERFMRANKSFERTRER